MKRIVCLSIVLPLVLAPGCPTRRFAVTMERSEDGEVTRELAVWTGDDHKESQPEDDALAAARAAYGVEGKASGQRWCFSGTFSQALPADIVHEGLSNHALVGVGEDPMGRVVTYLERMPGRNDLVEMFREAEELVDLTTQALVTWARSRPSLQADPERLELLVAFVESELRDDMFNVLLMAWEGLKRYEGMYEENPAVEETEEPDPMVGEMLRIAGYLAERGYLRAEEIAVFDVDSPGPLLKGIKRKLASVMRIPDGAPLPAALNLLDDPDALAGDMKKAFEAVGLGEEEITRRTAALMPSIFGTPTEGEVVWRCAAQPMYTNGTWDREKRELRWETRAATGCLTPQSLFAIWTEPDEAFQTAHLGRVMLEGGRLQMYVTWRAELPPANLKEWDAFVAELRPGEKVVKQLKEFRFTSPDTPEDVPDGTPAQGMARGAELILGK